YTARQWRELLEDVRDGRVEPGLIWQREGRFYDALRPGVEPEGMESLHEALELRAAHLEALRAGLAQADVFIFTLGLTEAWEDRATGRALALAPGVIAGDYDPARHGFRNFGYP